MKYMKRIISLLCVFALMLCLLPTVVMAGFNPNYSLAGTAADKMVSIAAAQLGRTRSEMGYTDAWCGHFVSDVAKLAGESAAIPSYGGCRYLYNAIINAGGVAVSSPQKGDIVFWVCTKCTAGDYKDAYWHVGIMLGSGDTCISGNYTRTNDISRVCEHSVYSYRDKVWHSTSNGLYLKYVRPNYSDTTLEPYIRCDDLSMLSTVIKGKDVEPTGTLRSNNGIKWCYLAIYRENADGTESVVQEADAVVSGNEYSINELAKQLDFSVLETGNYELSIHAMDYDSNYFTGMNKAFSVETAQISCGDMSMPSVVIQGKDVEPTGTLRSNNGIKWCYLAIYRENADGTESVVQEADAAVSGNEYSINELAKQLDFSVLETGNYELSIHAMDYDSNYFTGMNKAFSVETAQISCGDMSMPSVVIQGKDVEPTGTLHGNNGIKWCYMAIYRENADGTESVVQEADAVVSGNECSINELAKQLDFSVLETGNYELSIHAMDYDSGYFTGMNKPFSVETARIWCSDLSLPSVVVQGNDVEPTGTIRGNNGIKRCAACIYEVYDDGSDKQVQMVGESLAASEHSINELAKMLDFSSLAPGNYELSIHAMDYDGKYFTGMSKAFTVGVFHVSYNANGGSGAPGAQTKTYGADLTLSSAKPTRDGYTFLGWSASKTATSATYSTGSTYSANEDVTLYAVWKANTFTISFNANGGTGAPAPQTKAYGVDLVLSSEEPTREGYRFLGWSANPTLDGIGYRAGSTCRVNHSFTLYAIWEKSAYTVVYDANGGNGAPDAQTKSEGVDLTLSSTEPVRAGYTFVGWAISNGNTDATHSAGGTYTDNESVTLYAVWKQNLCTTTTKDKNTFVVTVAGAEDDVTVLLTLYKNGKFVALYSEEYRKGDGPIRFAVSEAHDAAKVMVVKSIPDFTPLCKAENVTIS